MSLGNFLESLRKEKRKSLRQVQKDSGISNAHLSQLEKDRIRKPSIDLLQKLSSYYEVPIEKLIELSGQGQIEELPKKFGTPLAIVSAADIVSFADEREFEGILPDIVRSLITSTCDYNYLSMPKGESVFLHGWDGVLACKEGFSNMYVPEGDSCWEMGRSKDYERKANGDIGKRSRTPLGINLATTNYIFVTPRRWKDKEEWSRLKEKEFAWKSVKVIDAEDLEIWLEKSPVVALGLARKMGKFPLFGAISIDDFWLDWSSKTFPEMNEKLLLEAGQNCIKSLSDFLRSESNQFHKISTYEEDIAVAFIYSVIKKLEDSVLRSSLLSRTVVVKNEEAFSQLSQNGNPRILIPLFEGASIGIAKKNGHKVIVPFVDIRDKDKAKESIGRVTSTTVNDFLENEGDYLEHEAREISSKSHGNLLILRRLLSDEGEISLPSWSAREIGFEIAPYVLFGSWNIGNENDIWFLTEMLEKDEESLLKEINHIASLKDSPLKKFGETYIFYQEYSFAYLHTYLDKKFVSNFLNLSGIVLGEYNDAYDLDKDARYAASIYGKGLTFSSSLREGIARSFALVANVDPVDSCATKYDIAASLKNIFGEKKDWKYWASLSDILMLLTEAAPDVFLSSLESAIDDNFGEILNQTSVFGGCDYAALLWAIEACAWEKRYLKKASEILLNLSRYENKSSNQVNQPTHTLWSIYKIWHPQTVCPFDDKLEILKSCKEKYPKETWELLLKMIPSSHEWSSPSYRPKYRELCQLPDDATTYNMLYSRAQVICDEILIQLEEFPDRWEGAFDVIFEIPMKSTKKQFLDKLLSINTDSISNESSYRLWKIIEGKYSSHLEFQDAAWSFKGEMLSKLEKLYDKFTPDDPIKKWSHIFNFGFNHPKIEKIRGDYQKRHEDIKELQKRALVEIIESYGLEKPLELIESVPSADSLGDTYAYVLDNQEVSQSLLTRFDFSLNASNQKFYRAFVFRITFMNGTKWLEELVKNIDVEESRIAEIYQSLNFVQETWDLVESKSDTVKNLYWRNVEGRLYIEDMEECIWTVKKFLEFNRPFVSFEIMSNLDFKKMFDDFPTNLALEVLDQLISSDLNNEDWNRSKGMFDYHLQKVMKSLGKRDDIDKRKLALVEWNFLPLFKFNHAPLNLTEEVNDNPEMFIDILKLAYKEDLEKRNEEAEPVNEEAASRAYDFLYGYKILPGTNKDGILNADQFRSWIMKARELCNKCNRENIGDHVLGNLLAHSQSDPDDSLWPHMAVRDIFEKYNSIEMKRGFQIGVYNKRGVVSKSCYEGGTQERKLAEMYREWAEKQETLWPVTASILYAISEGYMRDADREDLRAERDRFEND